MLGISQALIKEHGLVSRPVALAMTAGALEKSGAHWAFSVTGLAGPGGDGSKTPVGTVWTAVARRSGEARARVFCFSGSRNEVRAAAAVAVLEELLERLRKDLEQDC
jgi:PncC family amidohydrolase